MDFRQALPSVRQRLAFILLFTSLIVYLQTKDGEFAVLSGVVRGFNSPTCSSGQYTCPRSCHELMELRTRSKDIVVYSYNFGNYRNELSILKPLKNVTSYYEDYYWYFFTDHQIRAAKEEWTVCRLTGKPDKALESSLRQHTTNLSKPFLQSRGLVLTKWFKFGHVPEVIRGFKYIVHADSSTFGLNLNGYSIPSLKFLRSVISTNHAPLLLSNHPDRIRVVDEMEETMKVGYENAKNMREWKLAIDEKFGKHAVEKIPLFAMGQFVRKLGNDTQEVDSLFSEIFQTLTMFGLRRDQNVVTVEMFRNVKSPADVVSCVFVSTNQHSFSCKDVEWPLNPNVDDVTDWFDEPRRVP